MVRPKVSHLARCPTYSETNYHIYNWILGPFTSVQFKILFPNHTHIKHIKMSNEGDTGLLKYDTIEDCLRFLVVKFII